jgi:hypothetical protein
VWIEHNLLTKYPIFAHSDASIFLFFCCKKSSDPVKNTFTHQAFLALSVISLELIPRSKITGSKDAGIFMAFNTYCKIAFQRVILIYNATSTFKTVSAHKSST